MPDWNSFSFAYGPVVAIVLIGLFVVILRWAFSRGGSVVAAPPRPGSDGEYGLLVPVATPPSYVEGEIWRQRLEAQGIRANLASTLDGPRLLVWPADVDRARSLLTSDH